MRSMTGMGVGNARAGKVAVRVEIRAVNHRFLDVVCRLPPSLADQEFRLRKRLAEVLDRGRVTVSVEVDHAQPDVEVEVNEAFVEAYLKTSRRIARRHGLAQDVSLQQILSLPEAVSVRERQVAARALESLVDEALDQAMTRFQTMREREGRALGRGMARRLKRIQKETRRLRDLADVVPRELKRKLEDRLARLGAADAVEPNRLAQEVALLADRASIAEEVERLGSHLQQFAETLEADEPIAKRLGFLLQEMHREANTAGSKSTHLEITDAVLRIKEELENLREQIQNLE